MIVSSNNDLLFNWSRFLCSGTIDAVVKMIRYEGIGGFYKGLRTKIVQSVLAAAVLFMVKEEIVKAVRLLLRKEVALT